MSRTTDRRRRRAERRVLAQDRATLIEAAGPSSIEFEATPVAIAFEAGADGSTKLATFTMDAYQGGAIRVGFGYPIVVELKGLRAQQSQIPILRQHDADRIVGHGRPAISASGVRIEGVISGTGDDANEVRTTAKNGYPWQASIGASIERLEFVERGTSVQVNGATHQGPLYVARQATLRETSFVAVGADQSTRVSVAASSGVNEMPFDQWLAANGWGKPDELNQQQRAVLEAAWRRDQQPNHQNTTQASGVANPTTGDNPTPAPASPVQASGSPNLGAAGGNLPTSEQLLAEHRRQLAAETERCDRIRSICAETPGGVRITVNGQQVSLEAHAIREGWDTTRVELEALRANRPSGPSIHSADRAPNAQAIEAAFCLRAGIDEAWVGKRYGEQVMNAAMSADGRRMASLHALFHAVIRAAGMHYQPGVVDNGFIEAGYRASQLLATAGVSTLSLPGILGNVANKALLASYEATETVYQLFCGVADHSNFHTHTRYRLNGLGQFLPVGPDGELKHMGLSEDSYTNKVGTWGRMISLTRQDQINDDLGAFLAIPRLLGRGAKLAIEEAFFKLLLNSATLFVNNRNSFAGAGTALDVDGLTVLVDNFSKTVDGYGKPILVSPRRLLVPTGLYTLSRLLYTQTTLQLDGGGGGTAKAKPFANPHAGLFEPSMSPYLNNTAIKDGDGKAFANQSATGWYGFSNPAELAAIEVAYLNGRRVPVIESGEMNFNILGMSWRGYWDFGIAEQDWRGVIRMVGA